METFLTFLLKDNTASWKSISILDVGCADGGNTKKFAKIGFSVIGLDLSVKYLKDAKAAAQEIDFVCGAVEYLPFKDNSFNHAISMAVFQYVQRLRGLRELARVTKSDGIVIIDISNRYCIYHFGLNRIIHFLFPSIPTYRGLDHHMSSRSEMRRLLHYAGLIEIETKPIILVHWNLPDWLFRFVRWAELFFQESPLIRELMGVIVCKGVVSARATAL